MITRIFIWHSWTNWYFTPPHPSTEVNYVIISCQWEEREVCRENMSSKERLRVRKCKYKLNAAAQPAVVWRIFLLNSVCLQSHLFRWQKGAKTNSYVFCCVWPSVYVTIEETTADCSRPGQELDVTDQIWIRDLFGFWVIVAWCLT